MKHYKALIFDLDGSAINTKQNASPSSKLLQTLDLARKKVILACATGRSFINARRILLEMNITEPCIIFGGSQILNPQTGEVLWKKEIPVSQVNTIVNACKEFPCTFFFSNDREDTKNTAAKLRTQTESIVYVKDIEAQYLPLMLKALEEIKDIAIHITNSWVKNCKDLHITHREATKKYALTVWLGLMGLKKEDVIAVGDSGNDIPLFESAGLKVAMGNSTEDLKDRADFVTKNISEDGLAYVIDKYILGKSPLGL